MRHFIDRRLNPKDKNLGNRQRFMRRARAQIKEVVDRSIKDRSIADADAGETVRIPTKSIGEPAFHHAATGGRRSVVLTGNKEFVAGDRIPKRSMGGEGPGGKRGANSGDGEDSFEFSLTRDEFLDVFFEDLELPDLVKITLNEIHASKPRRAGYTSSGTTTNINVLRTMRNSFGRRLALKRPKAEAAQAIEAEIAALDARDDLSAAEARKLAVLRGELEQMERRWRVVPYIDPTDVRHNRFEPQPQPNMQAVMFCLMDVSGSMGEREKDLAKRFFILLHLFLRRRYERIDVVFIRHTHQAQEVEEDVFFYSRETGGTVVSTALVELLIAAAADWRASSATASWPRRLQHADHSPGCILAQQHGRDRRVAGQVVRDLRREFRRVGLGPQRLAHLTPRNGVVGFTGSRSHARRPREFSHALRDRVLGVQLPDISSPPRFRRRSIRQPARGSPGA